jgi:lauroyl/myristoyl acyltransferase
MRSSPSEPTQRSAAVAAGLRRAEEATAHGLEVRDEPLVSRVRRRELQRAAPAPVGVALAAAHGRAAWLRGGPRRERALWAARAMLGSRASRADVERLACRHVIDLAVNSELAWRPWLGASMRLEGFEHLEGTVRSRRGAIVGIPHFGPQLLLVHALCARGVRPYLVTWGTRTGIVTGGDGGWREFQRRKREEAGCRSVWPGGGFDVARTLLERGEVLLVAWDVRGRSAEVELLDRRVRIRAGAARLAAATGAALLPAITWREGARPRARIDAAVRHDDDPDSMISGLASHYDRELRARLSQAHPLVAKLMATAVAGGSASLATAGGPAR